MGGRKKTTAEYKEELKDRDIEVREPYQGCHTPILHGCLTCQNEWKATPHHILEGTGCPKCGHRRAARKLKEQGKQSYLQFLEDLPITLREPYDGSDTKVLHGCDVCQHEWKTRPSSIKAGRGCPVCSSIPHYASPRYRDENWLRKQYQEKGRSSLEIAKECNVTPHAVRYWLCKFNIEARNINAQKIMEGKKQCYSCHKWLPVEEFYKDSRNPTGLTGNCKECARQRKRDKRANDPKYRLDDNMSTAIYQTLKDKKNGRHWEDLVNYNSEELREHLENQFQDGLTWENYGDWHVDHIKPKSSFDYEKPEDPEFQECWGLDNLQPLWENENRSKSAKLDWNQP